MNKPAIAVVGYARSGKGQVAQILKQRGFELFSGGDVLRRIARDRELSIGRYQLIELGNLLREEFGSDILMRGAMQAARRIDQTPAQRGFVVDSLRNPAEVSFLKNELGAFVINVESSDEVRFARIQKYPKPGDPENWYEFIGLDAIDRGYGQISSGQNIAGCVALADVTLQNDTTIEDLEGKVDGLLASKSMIEGSGRIERF